MNIIPIQVDQIVMEASSKDDRQYMRSMEKSDINQINATLVQKMYENVLKYNKSDFGSIPKSKGNVMKVEGMDNTIQCLDILMELHTKHSIPSQDITDIKSSISTLNRLSKYFEQGFALHNDYLIITYNTIIMAIMDSTSKLIADYMSYMITPDEVRYTGTSKLDRNRGVVTIDIIRRFNKLSTDGTLDSIVNTIVTNATKRTAGTSTRTATTESLTVSAILGAVTITAGVLFGMKALISLVREAVFAFYHSRVKMADYLESQAAFLEMNRLVVKNSNKSASQKDKILKQQEKVILKLRRISDKIKINSEDVSVKADKTLKNENSALTLSAIEKQTTENNLKGDTIQII